jgi:hypothetical protein
MPHSGKDFIHEIQEMVRCKQSKDHPIVEMIEKVQ